MAKKKRKSSYDSGAASEFLVLCNLFRLGVNAFISLGNKKRIDLIIKSKKGRSITIDVKSVRGYSSIIVNNVISTPGHFIVVVVYKSKFTDPLTIPDFYIIPSNKISILQSNYNGRKRLLAGSIASFKNNWKPLLK